MDLSAEPGAAFHELGWEGFLGPVPNDDFEETDGVQVFCPISAQDEDFAADFLGAPPSPPMRPRREPNSPLRSPPHSLLPLSCNGEIAEQVPDASSVVVDTPSPKRRRLSTNSCVKVHCISLAANDHLALDEDMQKKLDEWKAISRNHLKRARWLPAWIFCCAAALASNMSYAENKSKAIVVWKIQSDKERAEIYERALRDGWSKQKAGAPVGNQNARRFPTEAQSVSGMGFLLTWHQEPVRDGRLQALLNRLRRVDVDNIQYERLMTQIREDPCTQTRWAQFQFFLKEIVSREAEVTELSACMEACLNGAEPRYHFHAMISKVKPGVGQDAVPVTLKLCHLKYQGFLPHGQVAKGRGAKVINSVDRWHCYAHIPKAGSIFQCTNYPRGVAFVCKAEWILSQWKQRKLTSDRAREAIIFSRD